MAAFAFEGANLTWQRVNEALANASPAAQYAFKDLKKWLATQKGNPKLGFYPFVSTSVDDADGQVLATGAARIVGVYAKKADTAGDVFLWLIDDVDNDSTLSTKGNIMLALLEAKEEAIYLNPTGISFGLGLDVKAYTSPLGTTDSTDTDCPNGFVIVIQP